MKITTRNIVLFAFIMLTGMSSYADPPCPDPENNPCTTPGLPIDNNLILLGFAALVFGSYTIYKTYKPIKKASN